MKRLLKAGLFAPVFAFKKRKNHVLEKRLLKGKKRSHTWKN